MKEVNLQKKDRQQILVARQKHLVKYRQHATVEVNIVYFEVKNEAIQEWYNKKNSSSTDGT